MSRRTPVAVQRSSIIGPVAARGLDGGRYTLLRPLGRGGHGVVYEAWDREACRAVALKTLVDTGPELGFWFKRGFRALQRVRHPHLVALYQLGAADGQLFLTMELVRGTNLLTWAFGAHCDAADADTGPVGGDTRGHRAGRSPRVGWEAIYCVAQEAAAAIDALHEQGILHRDIKPSNLMISHDGRLKVIDYGLACFLGDPGGGTPIGTPPYMAPEVARGEPATRASDWYSCGAVLHQLLTATPPDAARRTPSAVNPAVPADLDALCAHLLSPEPGDRPTGAEVLRRLGMTPSGPPPETPLFERERLLETLTDHAGEAQAGRCQLVVVHGPPGSGKSALLAEWTRGLSADGDAVVASARAYRGGSLPFEALDPLVDEIARRLAQTLAAPAPWLASRDMSAAARLFPVLGMVIGDATPELGAEPPTPRELRGSAFDGVRALVGGVAARHPTVLTIDDAQWVDADSRGLLSDLLSGSAAPPLLLVLAVRSHSLAATLRWLPRAPVILPLEPLGPSASRALAALGLPGRTPAATVERIVAEAAGNPLLLRTLSRLHVGPEDNLDALVLRRRAALSELACRALDVLVAAAAPLSPALACEAGGLPPERWEAVARELVAADLMRPGASGDGATVECVHDRIREGLAEALAPAARARVHAALGAALERVPGAHPLRVLHHYRAAGDGAGTSRIAATAAAEAVRMLAYDRAVDILRFALAGGAADPALRLALAQALTALGRGSEAAAAFIAAAADAPPEQGWRMRLHAAVLLAVSGRRPAAEALFGELGRLVGRPAAAGPRRLWDAARGVRRLWSAGRALAQLDRAPRDDADARARIDLQLAVAFSGLFTDLPRALAAHARSLDELGQAPDPEQCCRALVFEVQLAAARDVRSGGRGAADVVRLARSQADLAGTDSARAHLALVEGIHHLSGGRWQAGLEALDRFAALRVRHAPEAGVVRTLAAIHTLEALFRTGRFETLRQVASEADSEARRHDLVAARASLLYMCTMGHLTAGEPALADRHIGEVAAAGAHDPAFEDGMPALGIALSRLFVALYRADLAAVATLEARLRSLSRRLLLTSAPYWHASVLDLRARCALARATVEPGALRTARALATRLSRSPIPWARPMGVGALGGVARVAGDYREAARLHRAAALELAGMGLEARSAVEWIRHGEVAGDEARVAEGLRSLRGLGVADPVAMAQGFATWR